jgi:hypothetical protein
MSEMENFMRGFNALDDRITSDGKFLAVVNDYYKTLDSDKLLRNMYMLYIETKIELAEKDELNKKLVNTLLNAIDKK